jgi:ankyrin repeat protein
MQHAKLHRAGHVARCNLFRSVEGAWPLHLAARKGHLHVVKWLVANGADVNALDVRVQNLALRPLQRVPTCCNALPAVAALRRSDATGLGRDPPGR